MSSRCTLHFIEVVRVLKIRKFTFLIFSGICSGDERVKFRLQETLKRLCKGYFDLYEQQNKSKTLKDAHKDEFFGLRDFYR